MVKKALIFIVAIGVYLSASAQKAERSSFAVVVDNETYAACKNEIDSYKALLQKEGLFASILSSNWNTPQQVKDALYKLYKTDNLQGAIFIGNIPIVMVRDAQHLTTAFKMDQERNPMFQSSVPSDRFYDDFDLLFNYIKKDSINSLFFYYSLDANSPQKIESDIYTGRLKPTKRGEAGYDQIRKYFKKLIQERSTSNKLDVLCSYTGEGSFSNSLTAWKEEPVILREQFPQAFKTANSAKFYMFYMYPVMKDVIAKELQRQELDLMLFHEHGMPNRQYLTGEPAESENLVESAKLAFRERLRRESGNPAKVKMLKEKYMSTFKIDSTWFNGAFDREIIIKDSLEELRRGIVLEDVPVIKPNARIVLFDACYNGDFREDRYIAGEYIFSDGKTLVTLGNSVNVLQDKSSGDMLGLLGLGFRVGEWARMTNILESHIIGDPTFRFTDNKRAQIDFNSTKADYWLKVLSAEKHPDLQSLALHKLFSLNYKEMSSLLTKTYFSSRSYMVRLQCIHLLPFYNDNNFKEVLKSSIYDPYEFIRRKSVYAMGRVGYDEFIPSVVSVYINDYLDERVAFNAVFAFDMLDIPKVKAEFEKQLSQNSAIYDKARAKDQFFKRIESRERLAAGSLNLTDKKMKKGERLFSVSFLRNNNYHTPVERYLATLADKSEDSLIRLRLAEALGWYTYSYKKQIIIDSCKKIASEEPDGSALKNELIKTANRLQTYMR
ncbi:MAG: hypothetical protein QMB39_05735 [Bacteroidales bacterium]